MDKKKKEKQEEELPFWDTGIHPVLGYYYTGGIKSRLNFYRKNRNKVKKNLN